LEALTLSWIATDSAHEKSSLPGRQHRFHREWWVIRKDASPRSQTPLKDYLKFSRHLGVLPRGDRIIRALLAASFVIAVAGDLDLFAACVFAIVTAVFLTFRNRTGTWLVCTNMSTFVRHISLLRKMLLRSPPLFAGDGRMGIERIRFQGPQSIEISAKIP